MREWKVPAEIEQWVNEQVAIHSLPVIGIIQDYNKLLNSAGLLVDGDILEESELTRLFNERAETIDELHKESIAQHARITELKGQIKASQDYFGNVAVVQEQLDSIRDRAIEVRRSIADDELDDDDILVLVMTHIDKLADMGGE